MPFKGGIIITRKLLTMVSSYLALLLLLMPATVTGIISLVVAFVLGVAVILYKKFHQVTFGKCKQYYCIPVALFAVAALGIKFYTRWLPSSRMLTIATVLHMPAQTMLFIGAVILSLLASYFTYGVLQQIAKMLTSKSGQQRVFWINMLSCLIVAVVTVILAQFMIDTDILSMGLPKFIWGVLIVSVVILFFYCLFGKINLSISVGAGLFMVISTINVYVYSFRVRLFEPVDIFSVGTAMNVAENYSLFPIPVNILIGWSIFASVLIFLFVVLCKAKPVLTVKRRMLLLAFCVVSSIAVFFYASNLKTYHWHKEGAEFNGYILNFVSKFKEAHVTEPDNYSSELITELADRYATAPSTGSEKKYPHIIVIMDEAFSDLGVIGNVSTNIEVTPFISTLKEDTISGYALASVYGGNTANSEYEFLTGNSMAWLSPNAVPYQQYIRSSTYSMVSYLKLFYNYRCVAMHPYKSDGWNRPSAYEYLGFDACYFEGSFPQKNLVRSYISDQEMFEFLIETFEKQKENPLFILGISMQNHGGYTYTGENYSQSVSLVGYENDYPEVEQYLSLINETDKAVEYLITYFSNVEDDVVIVFFGDHQPKLYETFYEEVSENAAVSLDDQQNQYKVPFFIWSNYNIEEEYIECTSLNYLSSYVYEAAGIALPPYNQFLSELEETIPAVNANGFYSLRSNCYLPFDMANEKEEEWLNLYKMMQYNNIFDIKQRCDLFFPVLE